MEPLKPMLVALAATVPLILLAAAAPEVAFLGRSAQSQTAVAALGDPRVRASRVASNVHVSYGVFRLRGERGSLSVAIASPEAGTRSWDLVVRKFGRAAVSRDGQYDLLAGGRGEHIVTGGHATTWYARLAGLVIPKGHRSKQRVVVKLKGRPAGTFTLVPLEAGVLQPDAGTQGSYWTG